MRRVQCDGSWSTCPCAVTALSAGLRGSWVGATDRQRSALCNVCVVQNSRASPTNWEKVGERKHWSSWNKQGEGRVRTWRWTPQHTWGEMWGSPTSLCSSLPSQPSSTPRHHSLAPAGPLPAAVIYRLGEVSVRWCIWTIRAHFPLERGSNPFVFQSGLGQALPAASWLAGRPHPGPLPYSLSVSTLLSPSFILFFFPFSPLSLIPLDYGKAVQIFQVYWMGKGWGNTCSFSNKCFSSSPRPGNSSGGRWWGFQPASPSPWPQGCTYASIPSTGKGKKSGFELSNPNLYSLCWCVSLPQPRMEFIGYNLRANECFIALAPLKEAKCVLEASCLGAAGWKITLFFFLNTNNQQVFLAGRKECSVNAKIAINTSACRLKKSEMIYRYYGCRHIALRVFGRNGLSQWLGCIAVLLITPLQTAGSIWTGRKRCDMLRFKCQQLQKLVKLK